MELERPPASQVDLCCSMESVIWWVRESGCAEFPLVWSGLQLQEVRNL